MALFRHSVGAQNEGWHVEEFDVAFAKHEKVACCIMRNTSSAVEDFGDLARDFDKGWCSFNISVTDAMLLRCEVADLPSGVYEPMPFPSEDTTLKFAKGNFQRTLVLVAIAFDVERQKAASRVIVQGLQGVDL